MPSAVSRHQIENSFFTSVFKSADNASLWTVTYAECPSTLSAFVCILPNLPSPFCAGIPLWMTPNVWLGLAI